MKKTKQILSVFLSVCMIISCMVGMSVTASAEDLYADDVYYYKKSSIKQGDMIIGGLNIAMGDDPVQYAIGDVITIKPAGGGADIVTGVENWTADADYNITAWEETDYSNGNLGPYESKYGGYEYVNIHEFIFTVESATPATPAWTNGNVIGILDGTKLTVAKKDGAQNGDMGSEWTAVGNTTWWGYVKRTITEVEIQDGVTSIGDSAFLYCEALTSVDIPSTVTSIGEYAFNGCSALTSVTIPNSVTSIGKGAFMGCSALTSVTIPSKVISIGVAAFNNCTDLTSVTFIPGTADATLSIGMAAFNSTKSGATVAYGTGNTVLYDNDTPITTETLLTAIEDKTLTWKESTYNITFDNGGTAKVDGTVVTSAPAGAIVTISAPEAEPGTEFNGWTSTSEGVTFEDASKATTKFTMPANDVKITASYQNIAYKITMPNGGTASVDGNTVTEATKGATVTIVAPEAEPGTEFNGWTSTSEGVTFEDASKATTKFTMPANDVTISASFQNIAYNITTLNGGTAYVDGKPATTAEAGTVVTIKAKSSVSTPARFNGWTTTTEGVEFRDADSPETTFVMPMSDVTITASFEGVTPYVPSYSTGTSTTTSSGTASSVDSASSKAKMWAVQNDDKSSITVGWEKVNGATKYSLYVKKNGKLEKVVDTKKTKVLIKNPANNVNLEYVLKYTIGGVESGENSAYTASIKVYYKPAVKATSKNGAVILKWNKVEGAEKYRVYKYTGGKLVKVADTEANAVRLKNVTTGKTYKYAVKAYVDGKWTKVTKSDIVSVKVK